MKTINGLVNSTPDKRKIRRDAKGRQVETYEQHAGEESRGYMPLSTNA